MASALPVPVNPAVLAWARMESGYPVDRVAARLNVKDDRVTEWERGERSPTMRQIEKLAQFLHRPLSVFFLSTPPQVPALAAEYCERRREHRLFLADRNPPPTCDCKCL